MDLPTRIALVQTADWDPLRQPGGFEPFVTALAHGLADDSEVLVIGPGSEKSRYQNSGELFGRQSVEPQNLRRLLAEMSEQGWFIAAHNLVGALVDVTGPTSLMLHGVPNIDKGLPGRLINFPSPLDLTWTQTLTEVPRHGRVATCSAYVAERCSQVFATSDFDVVHPPVHSNFVTVARSSERHDVLWVGRTVEPKGLGWLVANADHWSFPWKWSGDDYFGDAEVAGLAQSFPYVPARRGVSEMAGLFAETRVVLCPYLNEGFGMVIAEAAAAGCRVVAFSQGGVLESGRAENVTLVPPGDVTAFNAAVCAALVDGPVTLEARQRAAGLYTPERTVHAYKEHLIGRMFCHST